MDAVYYKGDRYKDLKECCKQYGINVQSVHSYRFRNKDSDYDEAIDYIRKITKQRQFIWEDGSVYESINSLCRMKSISVSSVRDKARKKGMSLQEAAKGWHLVCTDGFPLGWGKVTNGTLKNKYLPGWRNQSA